MSSLGRSRIVVASSSEVMLQSLWRTTRVLCMGQQDVFEFSSNGYDDTEYPTDYAGAVHAAGPETVASFLDALPAETIRRTLCILDLSDFTPSWRIEKDVHSLRPTRLAARFPEVYWIFIVRDGTVPKNIAKDAQEMHFVALDKLSKLKNLLSRHAGGFRPWFDPNSLRASALLESNCSASCLDVCKQGLVFDEETTFAAFNSYFLYRQGIPTRMVATGAEFDKVEKLDETKRKYVILEDVELNYEDIELGSSKESQEENKMFLHEGSIGAIKSSFDKRMEKWKLTNKTEFKRVFVTTSRLKKKDGVSVIKPFGGLYDRTLLSLSGVNGDATFFRNGDSGGGHSAPGAQQAVAAKLLERVRVLHTSANDTVSAVHAAFLALEAERLLKHKTYAMAIEALTERHVLEAIAECAFEGAADDLEARKRTADLKREVYKLVFNCTNGWAVIRSLLPCADDFWGNWHKLHKRCVQLSNGMLECVGSLRETYHRFSKLNEEEEVLQKIRWWRLRIFVLKRLIPEEWFDYMRPPSGAACKNGLLWLARCFLYLINFLDIVVVRLFGGLLASYLIFVLRPFFLIIFIVFWILLFGLLFQQGGQVLAIPSDLSDFDAWKLFSFDWIRHSWVTFVALQPGTTADPSVTVLMSEKDNSRFWTLTAIEMSLAYLHLPILITLLTQKFSRR